MSGLVVDASVAVKWLVTEAGSEQAARLVDDDRTLIAPELLFAEAGNALWALCRRGDFTQSDYAEAIDVLRVAPVMIPATLRQLAPAAGRLALDLDHALYDCFYLALAIEENCAVITADTRFADKLGRHSYLCDRLLRLADL